MEVPRLIVDLAIMLMTASVVTIIFKRLKLPVILGYIVAGFLISPYFPMFLDIESQASVEVLSQIGVVIILFHIGLEFDLHKLVNIGSTAVISALVKMSGLMATGFLLGKILGLGTMDCVFLGAMLSISSTVVIQKCFEEQNLQKEKFTGLVMGSLVMEDVFGVFIMVVLSTISLSNALGGGVLIGKLAIMGCYLAIWLLLGIFIVPTFLNRVMDTVTDEMLTVLSLGFCFLMALIADALGFSIELGAFLAGSILAGTKHAHNVERVTMGTKDLFGAMFFLSVGMMVDPAVIVDQWTTILPIAIVAVVAKLIFALIGMVLSGQELNTAIKAGVSLAPIGEFSFIIAALGIELGVMDGYLYPVIVAASILTIIVTPPLIKSSDRIVALFESLLPNKVVEKLNDYTSDDQDEEEKDQDWVIVIKSFLIKTLLYGSIMLVAAIAGVKLIEPFLETTTSPFMAKVLTCIFVYFIIAIFTNPMLDVRSVNFTHLWLERMANRLPLIALVMIKIMVLAIIAFIPLRAFFGAGVFIPFVVVLLAILIVGRTDIVQTTYIQMETRFLRNLNDKTLGDEEAESGRQKWLDEDFSIFSFFVAPDMDFVGKTIQEIDWGRRDSVYIVKMRRGHKNIVMPKADTVILEGDKLYVVGDYASLTVHTKILGIDANIRTLNKFMNTGYEDTHSALACAPIKVKGYEKYVGKPIKRSGILDKYQCMVLGIQSDGYTTTMPDANRLIKKGDILWVMGSNNHVGVLASRSFVVNGHHE